MDKLSSMLNQSNHQPSQIWKIKTKNTFPKITVFLLNLDYLANNLSLYFTVVFGL